MDGTPISYIGKPTPTAIRRYQGWLGAYQLRTIWAVEFDRNGVIARDKSTNPLIRACDAVALRKYYHPFNDQGRFFPVSGTWKPVIERNGKTRFVFWPLNVPYTPDMAATARLTIPVQPAAAPTPFQIDFETIPVETAPDRAVRYRFDYRALNAALRPFWEEDNGQ